MLAARHDDDNDIRTDSSRLRADMRWGVDGETSGGHSSVKTRGKPGER